MLGRVASSLTAFESEYKAERTSGGAAASSLQRAQRLQTLRSEYSHTLATVSEQASDAASERFH